MRFQLTHKLTTYLLVLTALGALMSANLVSASALGLTVLFGACSWFFDAGTSAAALFNRGAWLLRMAAVGFFGWCAYQVWVRLPEPDLAPVLNLVLFLIVYKLCGRTANRDYLQIYVLAFLLVLAGAAFAQSSSFALFFILYVVLTTWTLILLHLRREMEENYLVRHSGQAPSQKVGVARILNSRRVIGAPFLTATAGVALVVCLGAGVTFALVPRVGVGFALGGAHARRSLVGFSDEVSLGNSGFLSLEDETVALRAVVPRLNDLSSDRDREAELDHFYWRGTVYETYEKGRWLRARDEALRSQLEDVGNLSLLHEPNTALPGTTSAASSTWRQEMDIVGVAAPVAFALDQPVAFEVPPPRVGAAAELRLVPRWSGEIGLQNGHADPHTADLTAGLASFSGAHYVAYSRDPFGATSGAPRGRAVDAISPRALAPYLTLSTGLSPRLGALAATITAGKTTASGKVLAVMNWLERTHEYSLKSERSAVGVDPVEAFLFDSKGGHCEYFASAAAILLRAAGVPTRYVNGFLGGEWNGVGQYITVRQNRAHAWVEAYLGDFGWMRVDATPPLRPPGRMGKLRQLIDSVDYWWSRWVVGYDLGRQLDLARNVGRGIGVASPPSTGSRHAIRWRGVLMAVAALAAGGLVTIRLKRRRTITGTGMARSPLAHHPLGRLYVRCLDRLAAAGLPRRPPETPREYALRIADSGISGAGAFVRLSEAYARARFGGKEVSEGEVAELALAVATFPDAKSLPIGGARAA